MASLASVVSPALSVTISAWNWVQTLSWATTKEFRSCRRAVPCNWPCSHYTSLNQGDIHSMITPCKRRSGSVKLCIRNFRTWAEQCSNDRKSAISYHDIDIPTSTEDNAPFSLRFPRMSYFVLMYELVHQKLSRINPWLYERGLRYAKKKRSYIDSICGIVNVTQGDSLYTEFPRSKRKRHWRGYALVIQL